MEGRSGCASLAGRVVSANVVLADVGGFRRRPAGLAVGLVGTYPPTRCGIATFTYALRRAIGAATAVVASVESADESVFGAEVVAQLVWGSPDSIVQASAVLNGLDVAIVQHEFGIYGGQDGREVIDLVAGLEVPVLAVLHTVLRAPTRSQRAIVEKLAAAADLLVVQSRAAHRRLVEVYDLDATRVRVVPHGATVNLTGGRWLGASAGRRPLVLTWGLLGRGKGVEFAIEALARLRDLRPQPRYLVLGETHPHVLEQEGEAYRESLRRQVHALGLEETVEFRGRYLDTASVLAHVRAADLVLMPYRSRDQVVSGVLVEAIASGKPVIATRFPHAEELLAQGSGILVPHDDAEAIATALRHVLTSRALHAQMARVARSQAPALSWETVGRHYRQLAAAAAAKAHAGSRV